MPFHRDGECSYHQRHCPETDAACLSAVCLCVQQYGSEHVFTHRTSHKHVHIFQVSRLCACRGHTSLYVHTYGGQGTAMGVDGVPR